MDSDDFTLEDDEIPTAILAIRSRRDGGWAVTWEGTPLPVDAIDVDDLTLKALGDQITTRMG